MDNLTTFIEKAIALIASASHAMKLSKESVIFYQLYQANPVKN